MVQWLRICLAMHGTWVWSLAGELSSHMLQGNEACGATTRGAKYYNERFLTMQSRSYATTKTWHSQVNKHILLKEISGCQRLVQSMGSDTTERLHFHFSLSWPGEGNGNPLHCSCLENPRDGEPGGLPSMGSHRVRYNWSDLAAAAEISYWTRVVPEGGGCGYKRATRQILVRLIPFDILTVMLATQTLTSDQIVHNIIHTSAHSHTKEYKEM